MGFKLGKFLKIVFGGLLMSFLFFLFVTKPWDAIKPTILSPLAKTGNIFSYLNNGEKPKKIVYGYLPYWSIDKIKYFQLDKLTNIAYFGLNIDEKGNFKKFDVDGNLDRGFDNWYNNKDLLEFIKAAKESDVRIALTIVAHEKDTTDTFLECKSCWDTLIDVTKRELSSKKISDVNLNFEYADIVDEKQKNEYTEFVTYFSKKIKGDIPSAQIVVATFADSLVKPRVTDVEAISKVSDWIFIMAYDFHQPSSDTAGPVAPIGGIGVLAEYDIETMLKDYLSVMPPQKIILGVPYYGYNWVVETTDKQAKRIPGTEDIGFSQSQAYSDLMDTILEHNPQIKWDDVAKEPYFSYISNVTKQYRQVYFENKDSLKIKYNLINEKGVAGVGIWALGYDGGYLELWDLLSEMFIHK